MYKANEIFRRNLEDLLNSTDTTENQEVRPIYEDGTPAHTKFITNIVDTYDISKEEFPISNYRPVAWKSAIREVQWIYQSQTNSLDVLEEKYNIHWWNEWDIGNRTIGTRYGETIKKYDLMNKLLNGLKKQPYGRRHIINMFQYADFEETDGLYPCVYESIWTVRGKYLDVMITQRSSDYIVSHDINRTQYCILLMMVAKATGYEPGKMTYSVANMHIYDRHIEQAKELLSRTPVDKQPKLILDTDKTNFYDFTIDDFKLVDFEPAGEQLKFELAI